MQLSDTYLKASKDKGKKVTFLLISGRKVTGKVREVGRFTILVEKGKKDFLLIFKHSIESFPIDLGGIKKIEDSEQEKYEKEADRINALPEKERTKELEKIGKKEPQGD